MQADNEVAETGLNSGPGIGRSAEGDTAAKRTEGEREETAEGGTSGEKTEGEETAEGGYAGEGAEREKTAVEKVRGEKAPDSGTLGVRVTTGEEGSGPALGGPHSAHEVALMHAAREALLLTRRPNQAWAARGQKNGTRADRRANVSGRSAQEVSLIHRARELLALRAMVLNRKGGHHKRRRRRRGGKARTGTKKGSGEKRPLPSFGQALMNGFMPWPRVAVPAGTQGTKISSFGFVATKGKGLIEARVNQRTCFLVSAWSQDGSSFDQGEAQNAFFVPVLRQNSTVLVGGVQYLPKWSFHRVCYTVPNPGPYSFLLRILFLNTADLISRIDPKNGEGYANYTVVLRTFVTGFAPPTPPPPPGSGGGGRGSGSITPGFLAYRKALPICTP